MNCRKAHKLISRQLDGELDQRHEGELSAHLDQCPACAAYGEELADLGLDSFTVPYAAPDFAADVMARVDQSMRQRSLVLSRPSVYRPIAAGLALAASFIGFVVGSEINFTTAAESDSEPVVEQLASTAIDPLAEGSIETILVAMLSNPEE